MRLNLLGGTYLARSIIADAQRCVNLYPEKNPEDASAPFTLYLTPGLTLKARPLAAGAARGMYTATNGMLYYVCGQALYFVNEHFVITQLGSISSPMTTPIAMQDNGNVIILVDGSANGWAIDLATNAFAQINAQNFLGGTSVEYVDTFFVLNQPGTRNFYSSLSNINYTNLTDAGTDAFDPTYIAGKVSYPDLLATIAVVHREIWLMGAFETAEVWYDAGGAAFPFQIMPGVFLQHGCIAPYSVCTHDLLLFWLSVDEAGQGTVFMGIGYQAKKISTPAIAQIISDMLAAGDTIADAVGMIYKQLDHVFYVLTFPSGDRTLVFDLTEGLWHERSWTDPDTGNEHRIRASTMALAYGVSVCGDWENGNIYTLDLAAFDDNGAPIVRRRGFPHSLNDGSRATYDRLALDMECGNGLGSDPTYVPQVTLRISDDRGRTYYDAPLQSLGKTGEYLVQPIWHNLGLARDRVFEVSWSAPVFTSLQGAWLSITPSET